MNKSFFKKQKLSLVTAAISGFIFSFLLLSCSSQSVAPTSAVPAVSTEYGFSKITGRGVEPVTLVDQGDGKAWPAIHRGEVKALDIGATHLKMAVIGDTGCRIKEFKGGGVYQNCKAASEWPLAKISEVIAKENYDFLLHVGDYYYREPCTSENCKQYTERSGPSWHSWEQDFYKPAEVLFKKSPILFVRGNHEDCKRGFQGWAPLSFKEKDFSAACEQYEGFDLVQFKDLVLVNFDNSDFEDKKPLTAEQEKLWLDRLIELKNQLKKISGKKEIWLLVHKPLYAYLPPQSEDSNTKSDQIKPIVPQFLGLIKKAGLEPLLDIAVSGHIHAQEVTYFADGKPQIVVGNTATALDVMGKTIKRKDLYIPTATDKDFGYALFERIGFKKWNWTFKNVDGATVLSCKFAHKKFKCK